MNKQSRPYLVTGGCGFVGRHLVKYLTKKNNEIWIIDDLSVGRHPDLWLPKSFKKIAKNGIITYQESISRINFISADLMDILNRELKGENLLPAFSDIFHLASIVGGRELIEGDPILVAKDLSIDAIFFLWATRRVEKISRILYASSSAAYPINIQNSDNHTNLAEEMINFSSNLGVPDMTYGWSKMTGEYLSTLAAKRYGLKVACIRPFSGYGEDQDLNYPIPAIAMRVAARENPLTVWGTGQQGRDFVYIEDCVEAFFIILDQINDGSGINIGSGKILSFLEVLKIFSDLEGYQPEIKPLPEKPVGVRNRYADTKIITKLGWTPKTTIKEGFGKCLITAKNGLLKELFESLKQANLDKKSADLKKFQYSEYLTKL